MRNLEENYISVVAVAQHYENSIVNDLTSIRKELEETFKYYEIIIVNNFSSGNTSEILDSLGFPVTVVTLPYLHSTQSALSAGVELAVGDYILEIPNLKANEDFSKLGELYRTCQQGNDFVFLSPAKTSVSSRLFYNILNKHFEGQLSEKFVPSLMTLSSRRGQNKTADNSAKIVNRNVSYVMTGLKCATVQSDSVSRNDRSLRENINLMLDSLIYHTDFIYQFVIKIALTFLAISFLSIIYALVMFIVIDTTPGWASTFILIAVSFAALFGILATVCKYLSNIIKNGQPKTYTFSSVDKRGAK